MHEHQWLLYVPPAPTSNKNPTLCSHGVLPTLRLTLKTQHRPVGLRNSDEAGHLCGAQTELLHII
jgi:hypothetical protein